MSSHFSYFAKNNTLIQNSNINTGRNPVTELYFGSNIGGRFSRFIFNIDLQPLTEKINSGIISTGCNTDIRHYLRMKNTSSFDEGLLNTTDSSGRRRATSFDLVLFRIPTNQNWSEGVGYDFVNYNNRNNGAIGFITDDKSYSERPSNWFSATTISGWTTPGIYDNTNQSTGSSINFSALTIVGTQSFEFGNEDVEIDMTNEINGILSGTTTGVTGWGLAFYPQLENMTGLPESYSVGFFTRHTQTYYEPYLETIYNDLIDDDRYSFTTHKTNNLYLTIYQDGDYVNLDQNPIVDMKNSSGALIPNCTGLTTCRVSKGIYKVVIPNELNDFSTPCIIYDNWKNLLIDGNTIPNIQNQVVLQPYNKSMTITSTDKESHKYIVSFNGILQGEKILNTDVRKVGLTIKMNYNRAPLFDKIKAYYRVYVNEGNIEVQVIEWSRVNSIGGDNYYFNFDTRDKIPNQYYVDFMVESYGSKNVYKKVLSFEIVNKK